MPLRCFVPVSRAAPLQELQNCGRWRSSRMIERFARDVYCGAIGFIGFSGCMDTTLRYER